MRDESRFTPPASDNANDVVDERADDDDLVISSLELDDDEARRRSALRRLSPPSLLRPLRSLWRASGVVALVALFAIVIVAVAPHLPLMTPARVIPQYTALRITSEMARCLLGGSWSHDGRQIASARSINCSAPYLDHGQPGPNLIIFDARTGRQVAGFALDDQVRAALVGVGLRQTPDLFSINYYQTDWSPDDRRLVARFGVYGDNIAVGGAAVVTLSGPTRGRVIVSLNAPLAMGGAAPPVNGFDPMPVDRWDTFTGANELIYLSPALAYRWLPSDVLVAEQPLPATAKAPAGSAATPPDVTPNGPAFTLWRDGGLILTSERNCGPIFPLLTLNASTWSPDGRYLLEIDVQARLPMIGAASGPVGSTFGTCNGPSPDQLPNAPIHDNGLRAAMGLVDPTGNSALTLAWSPDGSRLAVTNYSYPVRAGTVMVFDCASGEMIRRFTGAEFDATPSPADMAQTPVWSPDGSHLMLSVDGEVAKIVILGPESLGA
ncbi:MAG TPA: hypothetical protein VF812_16070 [Ktedonobacterales bacterium]